MSRYLIISSLNKTINIHSFHRETASQVFYFEFLSYRIFKVTASIHTENPYESECSITIMIVKAATQVALHIFRL